METNDAAADRQSTDGPNPFERFVDATNLRVSRAPFFGVILVAIALWAASKPLWSSTTKWELALHTGSAILSLLLLVLLENAGRRSEESAQEKLNVLAEALAALMDSGAADDPALHQAAGELRDAVGLEARH